MGKGLGIAALVIAIIGIFVPVVTLYVVWLALGLAAGAAFFSNTELSIGATVIAAVNVWFLSPITTAFLKDNPSVLYFTLLMFAAVVVCLFVGKAKKNPTTAT